MNRTLPLLAAAALAVTLGACTPESSTTTSTSPTPVAVAPSPAPATTAPEISTAPFTEPTPEVTSTPEPSPTTEEVPRAIKPFIPPKDADPLFSQFIKEKLPNANVKKAKRIALTVCANVRDGVDAREVLLSAIESSPYEPYETGEIIGAGTVAFCPQYLSKITDAARNIS